MQSVKQFKRSNNGYIRMGNNPMVGATVAVAVAVEEAVKA